MIRALLCFGCVISVAVGAMLIRTKCWTVENHEHARYRDQLFAFYARQDEQVQPGAILFFGASHIQGLAVPSIVGRGFNFGVGGLTAKELASKLGMFKSIERAGAIVIAVGFNDLKESSDSELIRRYETLISMIPNTVPIIVYGLFPLDETIREYTDLSNAQLKTANQKLKGFSASTTNVHYLSLWETLLDPSTQQLSKSYATLDGIHLNASGYEVWGRSIREVLSSFKALKSQVN